MASSESQRQIVAPEISATMPRSITSARISGTYSRLSGTQRRLGSSQAKDLTATTTSGGKDPGTTAAGTLLEAGKALFVEAFSPLRDDHPVGVEPCRDLVVVEPLSGHKYDLGPDNIPIR